MTLTIDLPNELAEPLKSRALAKGVSTAGYVRSAVLHALAEDDNPTDRSRQNNRPISHVISEIMADTPSEEIAKLPANSASEHDHYLYGWPKRHR
jgi:hypothetical protein